jgi:hypothetical protein
MGKWNTVWRSGRLLAHRGDGPSSRKDYLALEAVIHRF